MAKATAEQAIEALKRHHGLVSKAARALGVSRATLHGMIGKMPTVAEARYEAKEALKDEAEAKIYEQIQDGNTTMLIFFAKTQMKDRGYVERVKQSGPDGAALTVIIKYDDAINPNLAETASSPTVDIKPTETI